MSKETFGSNVGEGVGCLFIAIAIAIMFDTGIILNFIARMMGK